ncbi:indolepyruvate oxidoreductase subunit beta family protein [Thauera aromatica]|uniref:indolepyruvate oxidoreductase subunit beta family protein n=1 Tax=Thauera aromatica TaxID=59405 RepID=UPI001FFCEE40|nr:indolepyruvate oxidoreductase subunit beta family protein [Thauera aromatica]MCK2095052.1 indolepyruvate oxidoreductase subunit beta family protein [Thauera aromatica]
MTTATPFASAAPVASVSVAPAAPSVRRPFTILIAALGGEGGGVLAEWLVELATRCGYPAQSTSIPGVAQRTGATTYYVEIHPEPLPAGAPHPVLGLAPTPGRIDLFIASELLEAARHVHSGMISAERTLVVASSSRSLTTTERISLGDGRLDSTQLIDFIRRFSRSCVVFDIAATARSAGTVPSAAMFGAIGGTGLLPFARTDWEEVIRASGKGVDASLRGFALAWQASAPEPTAGAAAAPDGGPAPAAGAVRPAPAAAAIAGFPDAVQDMLVPGLARVEHFQDKAYGRLYLERIRRIHAAECRADPEACHGFALTREFARYLALWMAFDDVVRVAELKCSARRFERVRRETGARPDDLLRIVDFLKPGIAEIAGLLPPALARWLKRFEARRRAAGKPALEFALKLDATSLRGFLALRTLAALRGLRRHGARFAHEQAMIERWIEAIEHAATQDWALANELTLCARLIKGYGSTNERGKENLLHILDHLPAGMAADELLGLVRGAREAALADEEGREFDRVLRDRGLPARPPKAQPLRFVRRSELGRGGA